MRCKLTAAILVLVFIGYCHCAAINDLVNKEVERTIDLNSQVAKVSLSIKVENEGSESTNKVFLAIPRKSAEMLSYLEATNKSGKKLKVDLDVKVSNGRKDTYYAVVTVKKAMENGGSSKFNVEMAFAKPFVPFPETITQGQSQLVKYFDNHYFYSPYKTLDQTTTVNLASALVEDYSELSPSDLSGDALTYGSYDDIEPYSFSELMVYFENNHPFMTMDEYIREIEVSHWGNVAIEEHIRIRNWGSKLDGSFSRHDFQRKKDSGLSSFRRTTAIVPLDAADFYFRDYIGNISSSAYRWMDNHIALDLNHRFPLFGGWKTDFYYGYNLPIHKHLAVDQDRSNSYVLTAAFGPVFRECHAGEMTVKVILPEGASNIKAHVPFELDKEYFEIRHSYLDTEGRPVLVLVKNNALFKHNVNFQVTYDFNQSSMMTEGLMVVFAFFTIFVVAMIFLRADFSIAVGTKSYLEMALQREFLLELIDVHSQRDSAYHAMEKAVVADNSSAVEAADAQLKRTFVELSKLVTKAADINESTVSKVKEVIRKDKDKSEAQGKFLAALRKGNHKELAGLKDAYAMCEDECSRFVSDITSNE